MKTRIETIQISEDEMPLDFNGEKSIGRVIDEMVEGILKHTDGELSKVSVEFDDHDRVVAAQIYGGRKPSKSRAV